MKVAKPTQRVGYKGTCAQCHRQNQWIRLDRCASCRKGHTDAAKTTATLKPKENSKDWVKDWKPLNQRAIDKLEWEAQKRLGMAVIEDDG